MRIRNHRSSSNLTCISSGKAPPTFQALTMASPHAHSFPLAKTHAETSAICENLHHQGCPQSSSQAIRIFDVMQKSLDEITADVGCSNRVVAASELQEVLRPIPASKSLFANDSRAATTGMQNKGNEPEKFRVCTVNMSPWDVPSFEAFHRDSTPSRDHNINQNRKSKIAVVHKNKHSKAKHCWKPNKPANTTDELDKQKTLRSVDKLETIEAQTKFKRRDKFAKLEGEEVMIESALKTVLSECGGGGLGLTVREAARRILLFDHYKTNCNNNDNSNNNNRNACGGVPLSVVVRRVMLNSPFFVELNHGRFALWDDFIKRSTFPGNINPQKLNVGSKENSCIEHEKDEIQKGIVPSSHCFEKTKGKRSSRNLGLRREENNNMQHIPQMAMKQSGGEECGHLHQTKHAKLKSDCKQTSENSKDEDDPARVANPKRKRPTFMAQEKWVDKKEVSWLMACDGERKTDSAQQSSAQKNNKKRKAVKARSLNALVETF